MDSKTAYIQVRSMLTHLRAFQHVETILETAIAAEGHASDLQKKIDGLEEEVKSAGERVATAEKAVSEAEGNSARKLEESLAVVAAAERDATTRVREVKDETEDAIRRLGESLTAAQQTHEAETAWMREEIGGLEVDRNRVQEELDQLKLRVSQA